MNIRLRFIFAPTKDNHKLYAVYFCIYTCAHLTKYVNEATKIIQKLLLIPYFNAVFRNLVDLQHIVYPKEFNELKSISLNFFCTSQSSDEPIISTVRP